MRGEDAAGPFSGTWVQEDDKSSTLNSMMEDEKEEAKQLKTMERKKCRPLGASLPGRTGSGESTEDMNFFLAELGVA
jgi:hypothetical protein